MHTTFEVLNQVNNQLLQALGLSCRVDFLEKKGKIILVGRARKLVDRLLEKIIVRAY